MDKWRIVLTIGKYRRTRDIGYVYMDWNHLPFLPSHLALRMVGRYTMYLVMEDANDG